MFIIFATSKKKESKNKKKMKYVSKERRKIEQTLLYYLRNYRFFESRFRNIEDFNSIIDGLIEELKSDV